MASSIIAPEPGRLLAGDASFATRLLALKDGFVREHSDAGSSADATAQTQSVTAAQTTHLLSHPLLADPLLSSEELKEHVSKADNDLVAREDAAAQAQKALATSLGRLSQAIETRKGELVALPEEIGSVEDELMDLCSELDMTGDHSTDYSTPHASTSSTTLQSLAAKQNLVEQLVATRDYLSVLARAEDLKNAAIKAEESGVDGLGRLSELADLVVRVKGAGEGHKALSFVQAQQSQAFKHLAKVREGRLAHALESIGWPPQPPELQMAAQGQAPNGTGGRKDARSPEELLASDGDVRKRWADVMLLQRRSEKLGILPPASARLNYSSPRPVAGPGSAQYQPLLAVQVLLQPLLLRFYYHFDTARSTNRLDKPEWYMGHMLSLLRSHANLFEPRRGAVALLTANVQRKGGDIRYDLYADLLHGILRPLNLKLESSIPLLLQMSQLLSHTIMQAVHFDEELRNTLTPISPLFAPIHLADTLLTQESVFEAWVQSERTFASSRLEEELEGGAAWLVGDEEGVDEEGAIGSWESMRQDGTSHHSTIDGSESVSGIKTTRSARSVASLVDGLTARYRALHLPSHQLPFLLIQLSVLQQYAQRLERSLEAFESLSSAFSRHLPGGIAGTGTGADPSMATTSEADMVRGLRGLSRLLKACLSAVFMTQYLETLSATSFFLMLGAAIGSTSTASAASGKLLEDFRKWEENAEERELDHASLGELVRRGWRSGGRFASSIRPLGGAAAENQQAHDGPVRESNPSDVGLAPMSLSESNSVDVFEKSRRRFEALSSRALVGMEKLVTSEVLEGMRSYAQRGWKEETDMGQEEVIEDEEPADAAHRSAARVADVPTTSLVPCLSALSNLLVHLLPSLPRPLAHRVYRNVAQTLSSAVMDRVVFAGGSHRFSAEGAQRFARDVHQGWLAIVADTLIMPAAGRRPQAPWRYLTDGALLLALPGDRESGPDDQETSVPSVTLAEACDAAFQDDGRRWPSVQEAIAIDDRMALRVAREILRRRIDCPW